MRRSPTSRPMQRPISPISEDEDEPPPPRKQKRSRQEGGRYKIPRRDKKAKAEAGKVTGILVARTAVPRGSSGSSADRFTVAVVTQPEGKEPRELIRLLSPTGAAAPYWEPSQVHALDPGMLIEYTLHDGAGLPQRSGDVYACNLVGTRCAAAVEIALVLREGEHAAQTRTSPSPGPCPAGRCHTP